ncbi:MAG TPA: LysR family transcriptional regulator [Aggregatilineaceae bacterium]|jgi:DNA-binding transcriptional LysR family regulator|nr:LysR family transcriptional regulator [Aggregatilineaceae bacterium]
MLDLYELQVFIVAAETENFSETGRILRVSQPAVSGHIQSLEQRLKTQLFDRTGRNIKLNEVGEALVPVARNLLKEAQQVEEMIVLRRGTVVGQLAVGCSTAAGKYLLPKVMARFMTTHPEVRIICDVGPRGQALDRLCAGEIDLAVSSLRIPRRAVEYRHFSDDVLVLIAPSGHPWAEKGTITPEELVEQPIVLREASSGTAITLNRGLAQFDMTVDMLQCRLTLYNTEAIVQAVAEGIGPGFVSRMATKAVLRQGQATEVAIEGLHLVQRLYMARHTGFHASDAQIAFWNFAFAPENEDLRQLLT